MILKHTRNEFLFIAMLSVLNAGIVLAQKKVIQLEFSQLSESDFDVSSTLQGIAKVRDISEQYSTGGLYLMTHYGDRENLFENENQKLIDYPVIDQTWRFCSLFSINAEKNVLMGRNWDNQNVGSIIVSFYRSAGGYASISFSRAIDMGFPLNVSLNEVTETPFGEKLLLAPFYSMDGINEHGLSVAVAGTKDIPVKKAESKNLIFITYLIRKILDQTKTIDDVLRLVDNYVPFLLNKNSLQAHLLVTDASGRSVILEYLDDQWRPIFTDHSRQVLTNKIMFEVPHEELMERCWRYQTISEILDKKNSNVDWRTGLKILKDVAQKGTTWSVIYSLLSKEIYFSVYQNWDTVYHLKMP